MKLKNETKVGFTAEVSIIPVWAWILAVIAFAAMQVVAQMIRQPDSPTHFVRALMGLLVGAVVGRAAVAADKERVGGHHPLERGFLETRADHAGRGNVAHFFHVGLSTRLEWESSVAEKPGGTRTVVSNSWITAAFIHSPSHRRLALPAGHHACYAFGLRRLFRRLRGRRFPRVEHSR